MWGTSLHTHMSKAISTWQSGASVLDVILETDMVYLQRTSSRIGREIYGKTHKEEHPSALTKH